MNINVFSMLVSNPKCFQPIAF